MTKSRNRSRIAAWIIGMWYVRHLFTDLANEAEPEELQRLFRLAVRRAEWGADGTRRIHLYDPSLPQSDLTQSDPA